MQDLKTKKPRFMVDSDLEIFKILDDLEEKEKRGELEFISLEECYRRGLERLSFNISK